MARIIWIASYPKSGNTWVRNLVANLVYGTVTSSASLMALIPDIHRPVKAARLSGDKAVFVKTHWPYHQALPLREDTAGAIYVVRHPLDMIVSNLNFYLLQQPEAYFNAPEEEQANIRRSYIDSFIDQDGPADWLALGFGGWADHVTSWLSKSLQFPRLTVRYEDLEIDPSDFMIKLCQVCRIDRDREAIATAIEAASFERLRDMEEREIESGAPGFFNSERFEDSHARGLRFINKGKSGSYRDHLTAEQQARAVKKFSNVMKPFGYTL